MILVTGSRGQLGQELALLKNNNEAVFLDRLACDITKINQIEEVVLKYSIRIIINCAAFTAVDLAEKEIEAAYLVNSLGAENLARLSLIYDLTLIHLSTDYVFEGNAISPLDEESRVNPLTIYGKSKLEGERKILSLNPRGIIIRTSWLYSNNGSNFLKTILQLSKQQNEIKVVNDQIGSPTFARDLAEVIIKIIPSLEKEDGCSLFHYSNEGEASRYEFACAIKEFTQFDCKILPISTLEYPTSAKRPHYSALSNEKFKKQFNIRVPYWRDSLRECIEMGFKQ